jgi:hypothetical protein
MVLVFVAGEFFFPGKALTGATDRNWEKLKVESRKLKCGSESFDWVGLTLSGFGHASGERIPRRNIAL